MDAAIVAIRTYHSIPYTSTLQNSLHVTAQKQHECNFLTTPYRTVNSGLLPLVRLHILQLPCYKEGREVFRAVTY